MSEEFASMLDITATASKQVENDVIQFELHSTLQGTSATTVQERLRKNLAAAQEIYKPVLKKGSVEVELSGFNVQPIYAKTELKIRGYSGSVSVKLFGTDHVKIAETVSAIKTMTIANTTSSVSKKLAKSLEKELTLDAIAQFREKAKVAVDALGFGKFVPAKLSLRVSDGSRYGGGGAKMIASSASLESAPISVDSGKSEVSVTVTGQVKMEHYRFTT